ncbi:MAG: hypothetical protein FWH35_01165 [Treponema sp.]|nr:hypothetical protein [Treponema sp.]
MIFRGRPLCRAAFFLIVFFSASSIRAQARVPEDDPSSLIGYSLAELISRYGIPKSVYPVRGHQEWQDDVVFVYDRFDLYIYKDRVWQAGVREIKGIKIGDLKSLVTLVFGTPGGEPRLGSAAPSGVELTGNSIIYSINENAWPVSLRFDFDDTGRVRAIFIYRTDI